MSVSTIDTCTVYLKIEKNQNRQNGIDPGAGKKLILVSFFEGKKPILISFFEGKKLSREQDMIEMKPAIGIGPATGETSGFMAVQIGVGDFGAGFENAPELVHG